MNNPIIYVALVLASIFLTLGLGWAVGLGIGVAMLGFYAMIVDCTNGLIMAIAAHREHRK